MLKKFDFFGTIAYKVQEKSIHSLFLISNNSEAFIFHHSYPDII
ncbi:hypothetical protein Leryth_013716 [Lithospermum erythrorhizon]|nr:hypothetical protein Leryth_013716 [Lithospermum erythrorhizon]